MKIYHYHPVTGEYLGEGTADESPLEPGVFLIPRHATPTKPEQSAGEHQCLVLRDNAWTVVPDYRRENVCKIDNQRFYVSPVSLGLAEDLPPNAVLADVPPGTLYKAKWTVAGWTEGATQEEIDAIINEPKQPTKEDRITALEEALMTLMGL